MLNRPAVLAAVSAAFFSPFASPAFSQAVRPIAPFDQPVGKLETVATFSGPMLTGVSVSPGERIFVNFPRWGDPVPYTVAEVKNGKAVPFPDAKINRLNRADPANCLVCVQSVVVDAKNRLWILDPAAPMLGPALPNGPKLVCVDLASGKTRRL